MVLFPFGFPDGSGRASLPAGPMRPTVSQSPAVGASPGDLRSAERRGRETLAERDLRSAERRGRETLAERNRRTKQTRNESSRDQRAGKTNFAACQGGPGCDADESSWCDGPQADTLSLESSERTLRRLAASAITKKARAERRCCAFRAGDSRSFLVDRNLRFHSRQMANRDRAVRPDSPWMRLLIDRNPPAGICPAKPGLKVVTRCWASSSFLRSES